MTPFIFVDRFVIVNLNFFILFCSEVVIFIVVDKEVKALATDLCPSHAMRPLSNISLQHIRRPILFRNVSSTTALYDDKQLFPFSLSPKQLFVFCYAKFFQVSWGR